jgi:CelD/BcsL family acetyltransferase involved in cellulose biosynthesis
MVRTTAIWRRRANPNRMTMHASLRVAKGGRISAEHADRSDHVTLERIAYDAPEWDAIVSGHADAEVYHAAAWLAFLATTQHAEPVVAVVRRGGRPVGYFVGAIVRRYGVRILGSPLRGWTTQCMGFLLDDDADRRAAADALPEFAFHDLGCVHVELADRKLTAARMRGSGYEVEAGRTFVLDLTAPEADLLAGMRRTTRQEIRKAARQGLRVESASDDGFATEFYEYLRETFARQGLRPTYDIGRVRALIRELQPSGRLHMLRVRTPDGTSIATSLSVGWSRTAIGWGMGFDRSTAEHHPNELLWWEMIRSWKTCGATAFDFGGAGSYKEKYGGIETPTAHYYRSRWPILRQGRPLIRGLARARQRLGALPGMHRSPMAVDRRQTDDQGVGA